MCNPVTKILAEKLRREWKNYDLNRDKDFTIPDEVTVFDDINYTDRKYALLSVSEPKSACKKLPVIINFHGGGFFYGSKDIYKFYSADMARRGFAVITFNYRLSPEHKFPSPLKDAAKVLEWTLSNAEKYNLDTENIFFVGDSAGAFLALNFAVLVKNADFSKLYKLNLPKISLRGICLNCGEYHLFQKGRGVLGILLKAYTGILTGKKIKMLSLNDYIKNNFVPVYMVSAPNDFLLDHLKPQEDFFKSKGIFCKTKIYGEKSDVNASHVFHLNLKLSIAKECNDDEAIFMKSLIKQSERQLQNQHK